MTRPQPDDDRVVEFDDDQASESIRDDWEPGGWDARTGTAGEDERLLVDEVPPHWA